MLATDLAPRRENAPVRTAVRPGPARIRAPFARTAGALLGGVAALALARPVLVHGTVVAPPPDLATFSSAGRSIGSPGCPRSSPCCCGGPASTGSTGASRAPAIPGGRTVYRVAGVPDPVRDRLRASPSTTRRCSRCTWSSTCCSRWSGRRCCSWPAPITLLLQASSPETRRRYILPVLHSRVTRALSFPVVAWLLFAGVLWASHFSPLFNLALEDAWVHRGEHGLYLTAALLFWWPVVGPDPSPWRSQAGRQRAVRRPPDAPEHVPRPRDLPGVGAALRPLRDDVAPGVRPPLEDQQLAGGFMWFAGDLRVHLHGRPADLGLDAGRGAPRRSARTAASRGSARRSANARSGSRHVAPPRARRPAVPAAADRGRRRADLRLGGTGASRYSR